MLPQLLFALLLASALARGPMCSDGVAPTCTCSDGTLVTKPPKPSPCADESSPTCDGSPLSAPTGTNGLRERSAEADQEDLQPAPIPASPQPATMAPSLLLVGPAAGQEEGPVEGQEEGTTMVNEDNEDSMPIFKRRVFIDS